MGSGWNKDGKQRTRRVFDLLRVLRPYTRPHRKYAVVIAVCLLAGLPLGWMVPVLVQQVFDVAAPSRDTSAIVRAALVLALLTYLQAVLAFIQGACTSLFHGKALHRLRLDLFRTHQSLKLGFVQGHETGEFMSRLLDDVANLSGLMADRLAAAVNAVVQVVVVGTILVFWEWRLASIAVFGALLAIAVNLPFSKGLRSRSREVQEAVQDLTVDQHQSLTGHQLVRSTATERAEFRRYARTLGGAVRAIIRRDFFGLWSGHPSVVLGGLLFGIVLFVGAAFIADGTMTTGSLFAFFIYLGQFFDAATTLGKMNPGLQSSLASLDRITDLLEAGRTERQPSGRRVLTPIRGDVTYEDVHFGYGTPGDPGAPEVLHGISFHVEAGKTVAIVGRSGAGKSTLLSLIPRFFDPWSGRVLIDGVPVTELEVHELRRQIGIVPQDVFLFDRTVAENVAYGRPDATVAEIEGAAEQAHALSFIQSLPEGFETRIGERGVKLSAGERQRVAIAREILRAPRILILDEATSALDSETENAVRWALANLLKGRTAFIIAHRLSTVRNADAIFVVDAGRLVARGTHSELLRDCDLYRELAMLQILAAGDEPELTKRDRA
jgi:ATP-binding cassette, subfamily B, bacterial MsbA